MNIFPVNHPLEFSIVANLVYLFLFFIIYSFLGWIIECSWVSYEKKKIENRGYLFGPICPIYGVGVLICLLMVSPLNFPWYLEFFLIMLFCSIVEYSTSVILEKIFHVRWWDYTNSTKLNLNGRVSLITSLGFGIGGLLVLHIVHPILISFLNHFSLSTLVVLAIILLIIFIIDLVLSSVAAASIKDTLKGGRVDLTEEIKKLCLNYYKKASRMSRKITREAIRRMKRAQREAGRTVKRAKRNAQRKIKKAQHETERRVRLAKKTIVQAKQQFDKTLGGKDSKDEKKKS